MSKLFVSYSKLKLFDNCHAAFAYRYILERPEARNEPMLIGKAVHQAIAEVIGGADLNLAVTNAAVSLGIACKIDCIAELVDQPVVRGISSGNVEYAFSLPIDKDGTIILEGIIDYWRAFDDGSLHLLDWKTNRSKYHPLDNDQLGLYAWALQEMTGATDIYAELIFLRYSDDRNSVRHKYDHSNGIAMAKLWALEVSQLIRELTDEWNESGDADPLSVFKPRCGSHCLYCAYAHDCVHGKTFDTLSVADEVGAQSVAIETLRLEAALDNLKSLLKDYVTNHGGIIADGRRFDFNTSQSWTFPPDRMKQLAEYLAGKQLDILNFATLASTGIKRLRLSTPELEQFGKVKNTKVFRHTKVDDGYIQTAADADQP